MTKLEIIRIRLFNLSDSNQVTVLFQQFKDKLNKAHDQNILIALLKNENVENDWSIHLASLSDSANKEVANLAILLSETFRTIAMVSRDVWQPILLKGINSNLQIKPLAV